MHPKAVEATRNIPNTERRRHDDDGREGRRRVSSSLLQVYAVCVRARKILHVKERKVFFSPGDSLEKKRGRFSFSLDYHKKKED